MKTFSVTLAYDVPYYRTLDIVALNAVDAAEMALARLNAGEIDVATFDPDYTAADEYRVADIQEKTNA